LASESEIYLSWGRPKFSVVVPLFRTERYLGGLLESFDAQRPGDYDLEFIFVDDGSDDRSGEMAQAWLESTAATGQVIRQENRGVAAARNRGLDAATGSWITFPDSDDFLSRDYFDEAAKALAEAGDEVVLLSTNVRRFVEATGKRYDDHPLRHKFRGNAATVDLRYHADFIQTQVASAFFRLDLIRDRGVRFVDGLRVAEDAVFASTYLLLAPSTTIAPLKHSIYYYRRRAAATSAADTYRTNPDFYFGRFIRGYLPLLELAHSQGGVPRWLENIVLYDLGWFFPREMSLERKATHLTEAEKAQVIELMQQVLGQIDESTIINYRITGISAEVRALMLTLAGRPLPEVGTVRMSKNVPGSFELTYLFQGEQPTELVERNGAPITPLAAKTRKLDYFGQTLLRERIIRVPEVSDVGIRLNGRPRLLQYGAYYLGSSEASAARARRVGVAGISRGTSIARQVAIRVSAEITCWTKLRLRSPAAARRGAALRSRRYRTFIRNVARTPRFKTRFGGAWLIMDQLRAGHDNGEYLYDYLAAERPDINAWFVIEKGTPEWDRLRKKGFRLIAYRSTEHKIALQRAVVVASSNLDLEIVEPISADYYPRNRRPWRFVYLEHGVLQHNLAHWFNTKDIDLFTTASVDEQESIVSDGSTYKLTSDTVVLTGFPRHDAIVKVAERYPFEQRSSVLIAPTWRNSLFLPKAAFGAQRKLRQPFLESEYGREWMAILAHPALKALADEQHADIVFLPHPNFRGNMPDVTFPEHVTVIESAPDIHVLMSKARVTVTDYSSIFFDAALAKSRIVYFQFDQETFLKAGHTYLPGYWDYYRHGFGPVATDADQAAGLIAQAYADQADAWPQLYAERITRTLPLADGGSAKRITAMIEAKFHTAER
jgi:glycosyltransferase involved in cell wall biosynthesis